MAYTPTEWVDEVPQSTPLLYTIKTAGGDIIQDDVVIELKTPVTPGTPLNAVNLNKIEQGIADVEAATVPAIFTAKGDLVAGAGSGLAQVLAVGAASQLLRPSAAAPGGLAWGDLFVLDSFVDMNWQNQSKDAGTYDLDIADFGVPATAVAVFVRLAGVFTTAPPFEVFRVGSKPPAGGTLPFITAAGRGAGEWVVGSGLVPVINGQIYITLYSAVTSLYVNIYGYIP